MRRKPGLTTPYKAYESGLWERHLNVVKEATPKMSTKTKSAIHHIQGAIKDVERMKLRLLQAKMSLPKKDDDNRHNIINVESALNVLVTTANSTIAIMQMEPEETPKTED